MASFDDHRRLRLPVNPRPCPDDFAETFIRIGRLLCEEHYQVGRGTINHWLELHGKARMIAERISYFRQYQAAERRRPCPPDFDITYIHLGASACSKRYRAGHERIERWLNERGRERLERARAEYVHPTRLSRGDMGRILSAAFPLPNSTLPRGE